MNLRKAELKELWGASKNKCAWPDCNEEIVDVNDGVVVGEICHIHAQSEGGPRYDSSLDEDEIDSPSNLILLCPTHHTRIDKNPERYPAEKLKEWKSTQTSQSTDSDISDEFMEELVSHSGDIDVDGSIIMTKNQMGGQVAEEITNVGAQPRAISPPARKAMARQLEKYDPPTVTVEGIMGDGESLQLATQILEVLEDAGWDVKGPSQVVYSQPVQQILLRIPEETEYARALGNLLIQAGFDSEGALDDDVDGMRVLVGSNL